jgi:arsenate reductase
MAEGFCRKHWGSSLNVYSAGTKKHGMNARAVKVMAEAGVDLSTHFSKTVDEISDVTFDVVVTVCDAAKETCPFFPGGKVVHVGFQDPPALTRDFSDEAETLAVYRRVRDEIEAFIRKLPETIGEFRS